MARAALIALAALLCARALQVGFVEADLFALETVLRTNLGALLRGGALGGDAAPLSRELWWWWWGRTLEFDALAFHVLNVVVAVGGAVLLYRTVERRAGAAPAVVSTLAWWTFAPLGTLLGAAYGARELVAVLGCVATWFWFARGRWWLAGLGCGLAALAGGETLVLPVVLSVADAVERPADRLPARLPRLLPGWIFALAAAVLLARSQSGIGVAKPAGAAVLAGFAHAWVPPGAGEGLAMAWREAPWLVALTLGLAVLAVPRRPASAFAGATRGLAVALVAGFAPLLPLAFAAEPPRPERFAVAAVGLAMGAGALARLYPWIARAALAALALTSLGANAIVPSPGAPPRFTGLAALRARSAATAPLIEALKPWCKDLGSVPRTFASGLSPDSLFRLVLGTGARVACRNPRLSIGFVAELTPEEAAAPFGLLRLDSQRQGFRFERADARVRALVGEGLLLFARHAPAAALFEAARAERPLDRELVYPCVASLAAAGRADEARARWDAARRERLTLPADTLALQYLTGYHGADPEAVERETARRTAMVLADPTAAAAHLALGRYLLEQGQSRAGTLEISVACGISRRSQDVYWLARGYDALGASPEALEAYRAALSGGLDSTNYGPARARFAELLRTLGPNALAQPSSR